MWQKLSEYLLQFLNFLYSLTGSWGLAIISLTVIVRLALHPLSTKQMRSMQSMQRLQPRLKVLQEKYADDRDTLSRETMALYKENHVNPASGCLPLLVQLPILIMLFQVLRKADFGGVSFLGIPLEGTVYSVLTSVTSGIAEGTDPATLGIMSTIRAISANPAGLAQISAYLPLMLVLVAIVILTVYQQKMSSAGNPQMASMAIFMPLFMGFICLGMPGGLLIYWSLSSLFAVVQQWYTVKSVAKEEKPVLLKEKPREGVKNEEIVFQPKVEKAPAPTEKKSIPVIPVSHKEKDSDTEKPVLDDFDSFIPRQSKD